jgi:alkanesulfonate monooxygenase SsuD/methylene tetrahydromethanopterin reductase-like flavin-dependent oxidoreductase (luciferase family)
LFRHSKLFFIRVKRSADAKLRWDSKAAQHALPPRLDEAAAEAGRGPGDIRRILNVNGEITDGSSEGVFHGPVDQWVDELTRLALDYGFDTFVLWADGEGQLPRFAEKVMPAVRAQVASARST